MHGVSEVIAIILILMITISLAGLAYMFMSTTMSDVTASAGSTVDTTTASMLTSFTIESINQGHVYVRNTGQNPLTGLSVYVDDESVNYSAPTSIAPGNVGMINITYVILKGDNVKVTTGSGVSAEKPAPAEWYGAVVYWKLDESTGTTAYDSSSYGNDGTLVSGPVWTSGKIGNAIQFNGSNYVLGTNAPIEEGEFTVTGWINPKKVVSSWIPFVAKGWSTGHGWIIENKEWSSTNVELSFISRNETAYANSVGYNGNLYNNWTFFSVVYSESTNRVELWINGVLRDSDPVVYPYGKTSSPLTIGGSNWNGTMDEIAVWNRVLNSQEIMKLYNKGN